MKQVEVSILGQVYVLGCPEGGETLLAAAVATVDREMTQIRDSGKVKGRERIAVLTALNVAFQMAERASGSTDAAVIGKTPTRGSGGAIDLAALLQRVDTALADDPLNFVNSSPPTRS